MVPLAVWIQTGHVCDQDQQARGTQIMAQVREERAEMIQTVEIPFRLPSLNEIIRLQSRMDRRTGHNEWNNLKAKVEHNICFCLKGAGIRPMERIDHIVYTWHCAKARNGAIPDKSNIAAGGRKVIEDALVAYGAIPNDGWKEIGSWQDDFEIAEFWSVTVEMRVDDE